LKVFECWTLGVEGLLAAASKTAPNTFGVGRFLCFDNLNLVSSTFELPVAVLATDIDEQNHVSNIVYLRWVQEVATAHWEAIAPIKVQEAIGWVVLRHEIGYKSPATMGDEILLRTWVGKATGLTFERFTEIRRKSDGELLSSARTLWCPINTATGRPTRVSDEVRAQFSI
jgi:acyl-CoA thioester hydrolase